MYSTPGMKSLQIDHHKLILVLKAGLSVYWKQVNVTL